MTAYELDAVVNTATHPKQAIALGFALGYIDAFNGFVPGDLKPEIDMELFARVAASAPELATAEGREALRLVLDVWIEDATPVRSRPPEPGPRR